MVHMEEIKSEVLDKAILGLFVDILISIIVSPLSLHLLWKLIQTMEEETSIFFLKESIKGDGSLKSDGSNDISDDDLFKQPLPNNEECPIVPSVYCNYQLSFRGRYIHGLLWENYMQWMYLCTRVR